MRALIFGLTLRAFSLLGHSKAAAGAIELRKDAIVYAEPSTKAVELGKISRRTRVRVLESKRHRGCRYGWKRIEPRGWICAKSKPTRKAVTTTVLPVLKNGELPVGRYGRVAKKSDVIVYDNYQAAVQGEGNPPERPMSVLRKRIRRIDGKRFWQTSGGELIESRYIRKYRPSDYQGASIDSDAIDEAFNVAWARPREKDADVLVYRSPSLEAEVVAQLEPKTQIAFLGESSDGRFVQIADGQWILRDESRRASRRKPPSEVTGDELWIDVDLQEQVLVVYRGNVPLYATMVSSGTRKHRTPLGKYRIQRKVAQKTMASGEASDEQYSVGGVPWVMYVHKTYALHGAYWHNRVGAPRSHGCVNLAPKDAQHIYGVVEPEVPAGWIWANATEEQPGTLVHIRSAHNPKASERIRYN
tara:strand:- start:7979 stop:9223 length:1245 start_codon:yes stop_codon:yes gene_type:complete